jgi:hypothetical protein
VVEGKPNKAKQTAERIAAYLVHPVSLGKSREIAGAAVGAFDKPSEDHEKRATPDMVPMTAIPAAKNRVKEDFLDNISPFTGVVTSAGSADGH